MRQDSFDNELWQQRIHQEDVSDLGRMKFQILDEYMQSRENLPGKSYTDNDLVSDPKTTEDIQDELSSMVELGTDDVILYMSMHSFHATTLDDGTVAWAIWRDMRPLM